MRNPTAAAVVDADMIDKRTPAKGPGDCADELREPIQDALGWLRDLGVRTASRGRSEGFATLRPRLTQRRLRPFPVRQLQVIDLKGLLTH